MLGYPRIGVASIVLAAMATSADANFVISGDLKFAGGDPAVQSFEVVAFRAEQEIGRTTATRENPHFKLSVSSEFFYQSICLDVPDGPAVARAPTCIASPAEIAGKYAPPGQFSSFVPERIITIADLNSRLKVDLDTIETAISRQDWENAEALLWTAGKMAEKKRETRRFFSLWATLIFNARANNERLTKATLDVAQALRHGIPDPVIKANFAKLTSVERRALLGQFNNGLENGFDHKAPMEGGGDDRRIFDAALEVHIWLHEEFETDGTWVRETARFCSDLGSLPCMGQVPFVAWVAKLRVAEAVTVAEKTNLAVSLEILANVLWPFVLQPGCCEPDVDELNTRFQEACDFLDTVDSSILTKRQFRAVKKVRESLGT